MIRPLLMIATMAAVLPAALPAQAADELTKLLEATHPAARFADHKPSFSAQKETFRLDENGKPTDIEFWTIKDGDKYVATLHIGMCQLDMITFRPDRAPDKPPFANRYTWAVLLGTRITTAAWWDAMWATGDTRTIEFTGGGTTLTLTVREAWTKTKHATSVYTMTLRCDPVTGYAWDIDTALATDGDAQKNGKPTVVEMLNWQVKVMKMGRWNNQGWPVAWTHERTVFHRTDDKLVGFYINPEANNQSRFKRSEVKEGGYVAKLPDGEGWGVALVHLKKAPYSTSNATCNMWADSHNYLKFQEKPAADGKFHLDAQWRFTGVPPEAVKSILDKVEMDDMGHKAFPDAWQPIPAPTK